jgi:hypothetical protein
MHGGSSPQARRTARDRLMELREPALVAMKRVLKNPETDDATKVRAAVAVLDRTGMGPSSHVEVDILQPWQEAIRDLGADGKKKSKRKAEGSGKG